MIVLRWMLVVVLVVVMVAAGCSGDDDDAATDTQRPLGPHQCLFNTVDEEVVDAINAALVETARPMTWPDGATVRFEVAEGDAVEILAVFVREDPADGETLWAPAAFAIDPSDGSVYAASGRAARLTTLEWRSTEDLQLEPGDIEDAMACVIRPLGPDGEGS